MISNYNGYRAVCQFFGSAFISANNEPSAMPAPAFGKSLPRFITNAVRTKGAAAK